MFFLVGIDFSIAKVYMEQDRKYKQFRICDEKFCIPAFLKAFAAFLKKG